MKQHGICILSAIPVRSNPDHKSEMVTQLIFGETYSIIESTDSWLKILGTEDSYPGWIDLGQHCPLTPEEYSRLQSSERHYSRGPVDGIVNQSNGVITILSAGSILYGKSQFSVAGTNFIFHGESNQPEQNKTSDSILDCAESLIGIPYLWGGKTIMGYDCSGFIQIIFRLNGILLSRDASQQIYSGTEILFEHSNPGDLAFFGNQQTVSHVGIITYDHKIIHCSSKVRKDTIDINGIISSETQQYTHQLLAVRRII